MIYFFKNAFKKQIPAFYKQVQKRKILNCQYGQFMLVTMHGELPLYLTNNKLN